MTEMVPKIDECIVEARLAECSLVIGIISWRNAKYPVTSTIRAT